jgi:hypothetical protein
MTTCKVTGEAGAVAAACSSSVVEAAWKSGDELYKVIGEGGA